MIGIDSSLLIRYIAEDDPIWSPAATRFIDENCTEETPGYINPIVLAEVVWALRTSYGYAPEQITAVVTELLESSSFIVAEEALVLSALNLSRERGAGFADCLIAALNTAAGAEPTFAIDKKAVRGEIFAEIPKE